MSRVTPVPSDLVAFVNRFPGLTASGISQLMKKRSDWASGSLARLTKAGRISRKLEPGMRTAPAWRYYPASSPANTSLSV
jgi:hypothetical protein